MSSVYSDSLITESIKEELGVSDEVSRLSFKTSSAVFSNAAKFPKSKIAPGVSTNTFKSSLNAFGKKITIKVVNTYFGDANRFREYRQDHPKSPNIYTKENDLLTFHVDYINEKPLPEDFYGAFYHEFQHLFQDVKSGNGYKTRPEYNLAISNFKSKHKPIRTISEIIYYSSEKEIYAFAGQAYESMLNFDFGQSSYSNVHDAIADTKLYNAYTQLKNGMVFLENHKDNQNLHTLLKQFNTNYNQIYKHCQWAVKQYAKYIGRVIVKAEKDIAERTVKNGGNIDY